LTGKWAFAIVILEMSQISSSVSPDGDAPAPELRQPRADDLWPLARAAASGNPDAAATLLTHVGGPMLTVVRRVLGKAHADVDDVVQDAVIALLDALSAFRGDSSVVHFACRIALLTALSARRRAGTRLRASEPPDPAFEDRAEHASPLTTTQANRRREFLRQLLDELPEVISEALALHFVLGYTVEEIAASSSVSPNTVWSRLRLGKRALKRKLDEDRGLAELLELLP
jgi:RNA polymerase sigma factor (sigma-70 family)